MLPSVITVSVRGITNTTAHSGGGIIDDGGSLITEKGVCWSMEGTPTISDSKTIVASGTLGFSCILLNLEPNTTYYLRAFATNTAGTGYGGVETFQTLSNYTNSKPCPGIPTITDIDGNVYNTVLINNQCWMQENLKTTRYSNGTPIEYSDHYSEWLNNTVGSYTWYDYDPKWKMPYGALYSWNAVINSNGLCPQGWHVPTEEDLNDMIEYLGGDSIAGGKIKSTRTGGHETPQPKWINPNTGATNESNWTALPGGYLSFLFEGFTLMSWHGVWWSSSEFSSDDAMSYGLTYEHANVFRGHANKYYGYSVRCIKE